MPTHHHGRHEHGQNFLTDHSVISTLTRLVAHTDGPIIEIGPGDGAITTRILELGRPLTVVEIDPHLTRRLRERLPRHVEVVAGDFLEHRLPARPHVLVGNLPFHQTTAILRRILHAPGWTAAVLLVQWEVARRRAGVGGSTMMTAQWAPWFDFDLHGRIAARAFTPRPGVDGGILTIRRRETPAIPAADRRRFQSLVHSVFTGRGHGLAKTLSTNTTIGSTADATAWLAGHGLRPTDLPRSLRRDSWIDLYRVTGAAPSVGRRTRSR